jgi:hypothetical protein
MWVLILVFIGDFGNISTEQVSWYPTKDECIAVAAKIDIQRTEGRPYEIVGECFEAAGSGE